MTQIATMTQLGFTDISDWLTQIDAAYTIHIRYGWEFIDILRDGIDQFGGQNRLAVNELYELASQQIGLATKTLQNYVSLSRSFPPDRRVKELGINHHVAVQGLPDGQQDELLDKAVANGLSIEALRYEVRKTKSDFVPDVGNETANNTHYTNGTSTHRFQSETTHEQADESEEKEAVFDWEFLQGVPEKDKTYTIIDEYGNEETVKVTQDEKLIVVSVDPPKATAYNNHAISDTPGYDGDEWYTPSEYIEAARATMGSIDLDPATCQAAQETVNAKNFYTKEDNSLRKDCEWLGNVWLNPPYSMPLIRDFVLKLIYQYENGNIESAIIVTNNSSDTGWFHELLSKYPACFTRGRVRFWRPEHEDFGTRQGQTFFYLGQHEQRFKDEFSKFGRVVKAL